MSDQPSLRRRFQFRLRTLLIVVMLVAVACWVVGDRHRLVQERDDALQRANDAEATAKDQRDAVERARRMREEEIRQDGIKAMQAAEAARNELRLRGSGTAQKPATQP